MTGEDRGKKKKKDIPCLLEADLPGLQYAGGLCLSLNGPNSFFTSRYFSEAYLPRYLLVPIPMLMLW